MAEDKNVTTGGMALILKALKRGLSTGPATPTVSKLSDLENDLFSPDKKIPYDCLDLSEIEAQIGVVAQIADEINGEVV